MPRITGQIIKGSNGESITNASVPASYSWVVKFRFKPEGGQPIELSCKKEKYRADENAEELQNLITLVEKENKLDAVSNLSIEYQEVKKDSGYTDNWVKRATVVSSPAHATVEAPADLAPPSGELNYDQRIQRQVGFKGVIEMHSSIPSDKWEEALTALIKNAPLINLSTDLMYEIIIAHYSAHQTEEELPEEHKQDVIEQSRF